MWVSDKGIHKGIRKEQGVCETSCEVEQNMKPQ